MMRTRELMAHPVHVIGPLAPAWEAVGMMRRLGIRRLPVVERGALVGIVTWTDLVRVRPPAVDGRHAVHGVAGGVQVRHLMTADPITIGPQTPIEEAAAIMRQYKIGGLPVVDGGRLVGILTESDLLSVIAAGLATSPGEVRVTTVADRLAADLPRVLTALAAADVEVLALRTVRGPARSVVELVVREEQAASACEGLRRLGIVPEVEVARQTGAR
jgi:acetoin utilization protein AcuB